MQPPDVLIKILNEQGTEVGAKPRREIDKRLDIVHCADAFIIQNHLLVLAQIPSTTLYGGTYSAPAATMIRLGESPEAAVERALATELGVSGANPIRLGEKFYAYPDGVKRLKTTFVFDWEGPITPNPDDVSAIFGFQRTELEAAMRTNPAQFSPTFQATWKDYGAVLPF